MERLWRRLWLGMTAVGILANGAWGQQALTWQQVREKFEAANPTLKASQLNIDEDRAAEITAYLRPNPDFTLSTDGTQIAPNLGVWQPFGGTDVSTSFSYLHERAHKRELRLEAARNGTAVAIAQRDDQERNLLFNLRGAFVQALQAKAVLAEARDNLAYYDRLLGVSNDRFKAGDIAQVDLDRLELQRVQFETDVETALVNVRTAKIQLLQLLDARTPVEQFDITGPFEFADVLPPLEDFRTQALEARPDLKAAVESVEQARTNHLLAVSNGSTDPTYSAWFTHNSSFNNPNAINTLGASVTIPLRFFDRNQGEKERTLLDIRRNQRLEDATRAQVFSDVDSAYATLNSNLALLRPYKSKYLQLATRVRDTVSYAYQHGGASLLDFLQAQQDYRSVQVSYLNLIGAYLSAANQLNMAVGREVMQ
ncbi:MAG TPA: TolC family protein [Bryobacteraceae bacterium]|nr:TolC family protein [Bryobacteraceae bacterium]